MCHFNNIIRNLKNAIWIRVSFAAAALLLFLFALCPSPVAAERDTIRIGYFISEKYGYISPDGNLRGYDIQLSKTIGMFGGFHAEMTGYDNVTEMENALRNGEVDALIDFLKTEKREQEFLFTNNSILEEQVSLYTINTPDTTASESFEDIGALQIGYVSDAGFLDYFQSYCAESGIVPKLVDFHDEFEMRAAMERGETDACMTGSAVPTGYRVIMSTPPLASYLMLRSGEDALRRRIDQAISQLKTDDPDYISNLYHQYVASQDTEIAPISLQERAYLDEHPALTVAVVRGAEPFLVENGDGSLGGVIPAYYNALGEKLGVSFQFVVYDKTQDAIDAVAGGSVDILGHYYGDILIAEGDGLYDTMEYGSTECARLTRSGFGGRVKTAAVTNRTAYLLSEQLGSDLRLETYSNVEACYQALMKGETDAMIGSMTAITWLINQHTMRGVNLSILPNVSLGIRGAVSMQNTTLLFALNKAIAVSGSVMDEAIIENAVNGKTDLRTVLENLPLGYTITVVGILLILIILLIVTLVLLAHSSRERVALLNREIDVDGLTGAGSRRYGTELLNRELLLFRRYEDGPMIAMFDVDHFKGKNDTYGHEYGDFVLKKVVQTLRGTLRQSDAIIRWGGDEFILVCPRIRGNGAERIMEKVTRAVNSTEFILDGKGTQITISVGASFFQAEDEDISAVLRRCDSALYKAKSVRNTYCIY